MRVEVGSEVKREMPQNSWVAGWLIVFAQQERWTCVSFGMKKAWGRGGYPSPSVNESCG